MRSRFPSRTTSFDLVSSSLFAHHLEPAELARFVNEASRVSRCAVLINDLIRHPLHLALVYAGFPLMRSYVSRVDGVASVRRAYIPDEMREILLVRRGSRTVDRVDILASLSVSHGSDCVEDDRSRWRASRITISPVELRSTDSRGRLSPHKSPTRISALPCSTSLTLSLASKNLMEAKSRNRVSMWRLLKTRSRGRKPSVIAVWTARGGSSRRASLLQHG